MVIVRLVVELTAYLSEALDLVEVEPWERDGCYRILGDKRVLLECL